jgi:hypothetical protein
VRQLSQALPALLGVLFGTAATYLTTTATERARWRRSQSVRWDDRRIEAYTDYAHSLKQLITLIVRIAAANRVHPEDDPLDQDEGLPQLVAAGEDRTVKWEAVLMLGSPEVITAGRTWHQAAAQLQVLAMAKTGATAWIAAIEATSQARRGFYEAVRHELGISTSGSGEVFEWQMTKYLQSVTAAADPDPALD